jgi:HEAT repeat protein
VPDEAASDELLKVVNNAQEQRDVRIAAADALRYYRKLEVARGLVNTLNGRDFSVAWQARKSLTRMTGSDYAYDESAWLNYLTGPGRPFG